MGNLSNNTDFVDTVREKVRELFVSLIPEDQLSQMVQKEIDAFFSEPLSEFKVSAYSGTFSRSQATLETKTACSPFRLIVWNECKKMLASHIEKFFRSEEWAEEWTKEWGMYGAFEEKMAAGLKGTMRDMLPHMIAAQKKAEMDDIILKIKVDIQDRLKERLGEGFSLF